MLLCQIAQGGDPFRVVVEAGDVVELFAAGVQERLAAFHVDFFQRLQAIAGEAGADHVHTFYSRLAHGNEAGFSVGLQPFGAAQAGLEGDLVLVFVQAQRLTQQACGLEALAVVHVPQVQRAFGHAVEAHHQFVGAAVRLPVALHAGGQGADIARVVVVAVDEAQLGDGAGLGGPCIYRVAHTGGGGCLEPPGQGPG